MELLVHANEHIDLFYYLNLYEKKINTLLVEISFTTTSNKNKVYDSIFKRSLQNNLHVKIVGSHCYPVRSYLVSFNVFRVDCIALVSFRLCFHKIR